MFLLYRYFTSTLEAQTCFDSITRKQQRVVRITSCVSKLQAWHLAPTPNKRSGPDLALDHDGGTAHVHHRHGVHEGGMGREYHHRSIRALRPHALHDQMEAPDTVRKIDDLCRHRTHSSKEKTVSDQYHLHCRLFWE